MKLFAGKAKLFEWHKLPLFHKVFSILVHFLVEMNKEFIISIATHLCVVMKHFKTNKSLSFDQVE